MIYIETPHRTILTALIIEGNFELKTLSKLLYNWNNRCKGRRFVNQIQKKNQKTQQQKTTTSSSDNNNNNASWPISMEQTSIIVSCRNNCGATELTEMVMW